MEELSELLRNEAELNEELRQRQDEQKKLLEKDEELYKKLRDNHRLVSCYFVCRLRRGHAHCCCFLALGL